MKKLELLAKLTLAACFGLSTIAMVGCSTEQADSAADVEETDTGYDGAEGEGDSEEAEPAEEPAEEEAPSE